MKQNKLQGSVEYSEETDSFLYKLQQVTNTDNIKLDKNLFNNFFND